MQTTLRRALRSSLLTVRDPMAQEAPQCRDTLQRGAARGSSVLVFCPTSCDQCQQLPEMGVREMLMDTGLGMLAVLSGLPALAVASLPHGERRLHNHLGGRTAEASR